MTILASDLIFPNNVVMLVSERVKALDPDLFVCRRPLRSSDPNQSVGIMAATWTPNEGSQEFRGSGEPTLQRYAIAVQAFVKDMDEQNGLNVHAVLSAMLRTMLYRDAALRVGFAALSVTASGSTERPSLWGIGLQRFISNEIEGQFLYLSTLEFWLQTENQ